jgi:hypothetical protein
MRWTAALAHKTVVGIKKAGGGALAEREQVRAWMEHFGDVLLSMSVDDRASSSELPRSSSP